MIITFDTNVLICAADQRDRSKQDRALKLLRESADAVLLWQVACEFLAATRKPAAQGLTNEEA